MTENQKTSHWQSLVKIALLGTERSSLEAPAPDDALGQLLVRTAKGNPQQILLPSAAIAPTYQRAGRKPSRPSSKLSTPPQTSDLPRLNFKAGGFLARMLAGEN